MNKQILDKIKKMPKKEQVEYNKIVRNQENKPAFDYDHAILKPYNYWDKKPVPKMTNIVAKGNWQLDTQFKQEKPEIPENCRIETLDLENDDDIEEVMELIKDNYIGDENFKMLYTTEHLKLFMKLPSSYKKYKDLGVKLYYKNKLIGFIGGVIKTFNISTHIKKTQKMGEINFLSVHSDHRRKGYTELLIDEITYRISNYAKEDDELIKSAFYNSERFLPKPFCTARYYHRPIEYEKLCKSGFINNEDESSKEDYKLYFDIPGLVKENFRKLEEDDLEAVFELVNNDSSKYSFYEKYTFEDFKYMFYDSSLFHSYLFVDKDDPDIIEDFVALYELNSHVEYVEKELIKEKIKRKKHTGKPKMKKKYKRTQSNDEIRTLYLFRYTKEHITNVELFTEIARYAKKKGFDLINALDIMEQGQTLTDYRYIGGTGLLYYYFFNYSVPSLKPNQICKHNL